MNCNSENTLVSADERPFGHSQLAKWQSSVILMVYRGRRSMVDTTLQDLRGKLDDIDRRIVGALAERDQLASDIGNLKLKGDGGLRDVQREESLLTRLVAEARAANLDAHYVARLYKEILDHSVRKQQEAFVAHANPGERGQQVPVVVYLGQEGSYSHQAACRHFEGRGGTVTFRSGAAFEELLQAVRDGAADFAM